MGPLSTYVEAFAAEYDAQIAITYYHRFRVSTYTYRDLYQLALKCASYFISRGVKRGDRILVYGENSPEWVVILCCAALSGITFVPIDSKSPSEFAEKVRKKTDAKWVISDNPVQSLEGVNHLMLDDLFMEIKDADPALLKERNWSLTGDDIFEILYTSGTTTDPKGAVIRHCNLVASIASMRKRLVCDERCCFLSMLPLSHVLEQNAGCLSVLRFGARIIYTKQVRFSRIVEILIQEKVTHIIAVPAILKGFRNKILEGLQDKQAFIAHLTQKEFLVVNSLALEMPFGLL